MKSLGLLLMLIAVAVSAAEPPESAPPAAQPTAEAPVRVSVVETQAAEPSLPMRKDPASQGWLLLVAGLALAGWMAHRRLSYL